MEFSAVLEALRDQMGDRHIMLSYQWDIQKLVAQVYDCVKAHDINIWMDIHGGVTGNINEAMATGVEGAAIVCCFMSQKYEKSKNCSAELNYANDRSTVIVPCMTQDRTDEGNPYRASGWLGIITAGKLWIDFKGAEQLEKRVEQLLTECCGRLSKAEVPVGKMVTLGKSMTPKKPKQPARKKRKKQVEESTSGEMIILADEDSITVPLNQPLEPGDQIEAWGFYEYGEKFSFNLIGDSWNEVLLHFDIRPTENVVVMNNKASGHWRHEVRDNRIVRKFERGELDENFHLLIKCEKKEFVFFMNGEKTRKPFPIRAPLKDGRNIVFRDEEDLGRWKKVRIPEARASQDGRGVSDLKRNEEVILEKSLSIGDCLEVWGKVQEDDRYSLNIMRGTKDYLLHMDIRPESRTICLDTTLHEKWPGSYNKHLSDEYAILTSNPQGQFHIKVQFEEEGMELSIDDHTYAGIIPYEFDLTEATHVRCSVSEGSDINPWNKIALPKSTQMLTTYSTYEFDKLSIGDIINVTGYMRKNLGAFSFNIIEDDINWHLHIAVRPASRHVVLNAMLGGGWGQELYYDIPNTLLNCGMFDIFVIIEEKTFKIEMSKDGENENVLLDMRMPFRGDFSKVKYIMFKDFEDNVFTELHMPDGSSYVREI